MGPQELLHRHQHHMNRRGVLCRGAKGSLVLQSYLLRLGPHFCRAKPTTDSGRKLFLRHTSTTIKPDSYAARKNCVAISWTVTTVQELCVLVVSVGTCAA